MKISTLGVSDWTTINSISSSIVIDGNHAVLNRSVDDIVSCYLRKTVRAQAGTTFTVRVVAKVSAGISGMIIVDYPTNPANAKQRVSVDSNNFTVFELSYSCPVATKDGDTVSFAVGLFSGNYGTMEIVDVSIIADVVAPRVAAMGLIFINQGNFQTNTGFTNMGIRGYDYDNNNRNLKVYLDVVPVASSPIFNVTLTEGSGNSVSLVPRVSSYNRSEGYVLLSFYDLSNPAPGYKPDLNTIVVNVWFTAFM